LGTSTPSAWSQWTTAFVQRLRELGADAVVGTADAERARAEVLAITGDGVDHAVDYTGNPELLRWLAGVMRLGGTLVVTSEQGSDPRPFTAADMIRLELNLFGPRGARMNDMLAVLKLLGERRHPHAHRGALSAGNAARPGRPGRSAVGSAAERRLFRTYARPRAA
jgi:threonine dehydrogenase-like Zn-dependent dehydrogenase